VATAQHYTAEPVAKPAATRLVVKDVMWTCNDAGRCSGSESNSRPAIVCASLARKVGTLRSFSAAGSAFAADALEKCNARAK